MNFITASSLLMGLLWIGAVAIYGISTRYLGRLGD
ncbi:hypothetical protein C7378_3145 [Acidipila rosea]|uniref:Uncharacterized protein n=1 Tax=Acidipila rosea TaxID=768535 RepID=A0A4R1KYZ7_9BACT|nr:hypothetical protein C7378_3145 [Acidipila rosea]